MRNLIVTISLILISVLTASLIDFWAGLFYFSLSALAILCVYWAVIFILRYREDYFVDFKNDFNFYKINLVNSSNLTLEEINNNEGFYIKKFKKTLVRDKIIDIFKILLAIVFAITCISSMIFG